MRRRIRAVLAAAAVLCLAASAREPDFAWHLPSGTAPPPVPADNPMSAAKVALGRKLFYDADLSIDGTTACATCHEQHRAFADGNATHPGVRDARGRRNVMGLANVAYFAPLTWARPDLRGLEQQILVPVAGEHPVEMGMAGQDAELVRRLFAQPCYRRMFAAAFPERGGEIDLDAVVKAIAAFERTLLSFDSPYDRSRRGEANALDTAASRGAALFFGGRLQCATCHTAPNFTDLAFHRIGPSPSDRGLAEATGDAQDDAKFRTPSLRNVALTAPYLHDGSAKTLAEAIRAHGLAPSPGEMAELVAFLGALTDRNFVTDPRFALPAASCGP